MAELRLLGRLDPLVQLERLRHSGLNFDPQELAEATADSDWRVDHYRQALRPEAPGEPVEGGSWSIARDLSASYDFVDPSIVRAYFDPSEPVENRTMLLEVRFWGLRIYAGVRAGAVYDDLRREQGRKARVSGWSYQTLSGHFEKGRMDYELWKWLDSGEVDFRIEAASRRANPGNPLVAVGFRLFGRRKQGEFMRTACERMDALTRAVLRGERARDTQARELLSSPGRAAMSSEPRRRPHPR